MPLSTAYAQRVNATPGMLMLLGLIGVITGLAFIKNADFGVENANRYRLAGRPARSSDRWVFVAVGRLCVAFSTVLLGLGLLREVM